MNKLTNLRRKLIITGIIIFVIILIVVLLAEVDNLIRMVWGVEEGVNFLNQDLSDYLPLEVEDLVYRLTPEVTIYPLPASVDKDTGEIKSATKGQIVDLTATLNQIMEAEEGSRVLPVSYSLEPIITAEDVAKVTEKLDGYTTIITGRPGRRANIKLAAKLINNELLLPREIFSFNQVVGPRTKERGFKEGPQIVEGRLTKGVGGGICQVSSTLYNALPDYFKIVERHAHSRDVGYVPEGKDATVTWDYLDFKFKNNLSSPIIIRTKILQGRLKVFILVSEAGKEEISEE
ncbi:hypothetical protein JCM16358_07170 [Halanaerocella petrolearia]